MSLRNRISHGLLAMLVALGCLGGNLPCLVGPGDADRHDSRQIGGATQTDSQPVVLSRDQERDLTWLARRLPCVPGAIPGSAGPADGGQTRLLWPADLLTGRAGPAARSLVSLHCLLTV